MSYRGSWRGIGLAVGMLAAMATAAEAQPVFTHQSVI